MDKLPGASLLGDLRDARWIIAKGVLFLLAGVMASGLLWLELPRARVLVLHSLAVWCFCRCYYFAFYVIEHYIDPTFKYAGLGSAIAYLWRSRKRGT